MGPVLTAEKLAVDQDDMWFYKMKNPETMIWDTDYGDIIPAVVVVGVVVVLVMVVGVVVVLVAVVGVVVVLVVI